MTTCVLFAMWFLGASQWQAMYVREDGLVITRAMTFSEAMLLEPLLEKVVACPLQHPGVCS